jgi:alpha-beta hydrolase superfamily lysophospholipase
MQRPRPAWHDRAVHRRSRTVIPVQPRELGAEDGLAFSLWTPSRIERPRGGIVILHGAGSCKESHYDFARAATAAGFAAIAFDQRGHGASLGAMNARVLDDAATVTDLLRSRIGHPDLPIALRGSSMGGYLAIVAAPHVGAQAVVAICPASAEGLRRGLVSRRLAFDADVDGLEQFLSAHDLAEGVRTLATPLLLLHAEGDEQVPVEQSRELAQLTTAEESRLLTVRGGHHRSVQHDPELQATSLRWLETALNPVR